MITSFSLSPAASAEPLGTILVIIAPFTSLGSMSEAKRLIKQKAVDVNGKLVDNATYIVAVGDEIKVGSRTLKEKVRIFLLCADVFSVLLFFLSLSVPIKIMLTF